MLALERLDSTIDRTETWIMKASGLKKEPDELVRA